MPAHLVNLADLDPGTIEVGDKERQPFSLALHVAQGVVRASSIILLATWATEIQIFSPLTW